MVKSTVKKYTLHLLRVKSLAQGQLDRDGECCILPAIRKLENSIL